MMISELHENVCDCLPIAFLLYIGIKHLFDHLPHRYAAGRWKICWTISYLTNSQCAYLDSDALAIKVCIIYKKCNEFKGCKIMHDYVNALIQTLYDTCLFRSFCDTNLTKPVN